MRARGRWGSRDVPRYILSRLVLAVVMALLATFVIFLLANTVPGDPVLAQLGDLAASNKEFVAEWRAKWGLDLPLWQRYAVFLERLFHGDLGLITRTTRASMLESMQQDYVRVARAKGIRESRIVIGHVLPNALIPIVTLGGLAYANLLTGAVLTETVFSWPGLGRYTFRSAVSLDFPAIMGITLIVAVVYLIINLLIDISYALLDPRVVR